MQKNYDLISPGTINYGFTRYNQLTFNTYLSEPEFWEMKYKKFEGKKRPLKV